VTFSGSGVVPGTPIEDFSAYRIAYYTPGAGMENSREGSAISESDDPFTIVDYGPQGTLPSEIKKPSIYVVFSQPVVPLAQLGAPLREDAGLFTIEPPLKGVFRWYGSRLLSFEPEEENLPQQEYTVTVSDRIRSLGGKKLEGDRVFSFETERLQVLSWDLGPGDQWVSPYDADPEEARYLRITFSYPVNLTEIAQWLDVRVDGQSWAFDLSRPEKRGWDSYPPEQYVLLTLKERLPLDTEVEAVLRAGARSEPGWLGTLEDQGYPFHTLLPFHYESWDVRSSSRSLTEEGNNISLYLHFSHSVDPQEPPALFSVKGQKALTKENTQVYGNTVVIHSLPLEYETSYDVGISGKVKDLWGRTLGHDQTIRVKVGQAESYVRTRNSGSRMLEAQFPPRILWEAQNPVELAFGMGRLDNPYQTWNEGLRVISGLPRNTKRYFIEDLSPLLGNGGRGTVGIRWRYLYRSSWNSEVYENDNWLTVQVTDLGLTVRYAWNQVLVWVTRLSTGEAVSGAEVELLEGARERRRGRTDAQGLAVFDFQEGELTSLFKAPRYWGSEEDQGLRIRASLGGGAAAGGDQVEFIPNGSHNLWRFDVDAQEDPFTVEREKPLIFLFTDRGLYRPGETVTFRGIDRNLDRGKFLVYRGPYRVDIRSPLGDGKPLLSLEGETTANGGSWGSFTLPGDLDPGPYSLTYTRRRERGGPEGQGEDSPSRTISFTVAHFEGLRFQASVKFPEVPFYQGETIRAELEASYLAGGVLAGSPYTCYWTREPLGFNPGGDWRYWRFGPERYDGRYMVDSGEGTLGPDGKAELAVEPERSGIEGAAYRYRVEAGVQDVSRQEIAARASAVVHPGSFYIASRLDGGTQSEGNRPSAWFLEAGKPGVVSWALVSPGGEISPGAGSLRAQLIRYDWKQSRQAGIGGRINLSWEQVEEVVEDRTIPLQGGVSKGTIPFTPVESGQWEVRLHALDGKGRPIVTRYGFYVSGGGWVRWGGGDDDQITLRPDRDTYAPGDTARILVQSPLPRGKYLLTLEREGIIKEEIIELEGSARTIEIPIEEAWTPVIYAALSSYTVRSGPPDHAWNEPDLDKPKGLFGLTPLYVDNESRHYRVEIQGDKGVYGPGEEAEVTLQVTRQGKPAAGVELTFMAVDRAVIDLIDYHVPDPLAYFYSTTNFPLAVRGGDSRSLLIDPVTYTVNDLQGGDEGSKLEERKDFRPTAVFEPCLVTDPEGRVKVKFRLPDSLTIYRLTAVAVGVEDFGLKEEELRVSAPLTAVAALPRGLRWRDTGQVSLILSNLENEPVEAAVSVGIEKSLAEGDWEEVLMVDEAAEKKVTIAPRATVEVPFRLAALGPGEAQVVFTLRSKAVNERIIKPLRVERPVVYEMVTTIGSLMGKSPEENPFIEEGVQLPGVIPPGTGTLAVTLSASRLAMLREAVAYLLDYPYGCLEQRTARLLPLLAFGDHLGAFGLESPVKDPARTIQEELAFLGKCRLADGSFPYWPGGRQGDVFVSLRAAHILSLAREKGYEIPEGLDPRKIFSWLANDDRAREILDRDLFLRGYYLWVRAMAGERVGSEISSYLKLGDVVGIAGFCFAGLASLENGDVGMARSSQSRVKRFIRPGTRSLDLQDTAESSHSGGFSYWGADSDRYALALMLYQGLSPEDDMTSRLAGSLIERQRRGVWNNTASSFWAVLAFGRVADAEARETVDFQAKVSLGGAMLLQEEFKSYGGVPVSGRWSLEEAPLEGLDRDRVLPLRIERAGAGSLYYTGSLRYGMPAELAAPRDEGLGVFVETLDASGAPVSGQALIPGKTYTRRVTVSSSRERTFLALRAPVPSGAEILDAVFVTSSTLPPPGEGEEDSSGETWRGPQPVRFILDNEVRFHWDFFPAGRKEVEFRFRAVTPGVYPVPPTQAECMYEGEIFGRSGGELSIIRG